MKFGDLSAWLEWKKSCIESLIDEFVWDGTDDRHHFLWEELNVLFRKLDRPLRRPRVGR